MRREKQCGGKSLYRSDMVWRREDISIFIVNWDNKASKISNLDALVFFDDNPVERALVRQFLPMVAVPEVPENPVDYVRCLSRAGYFDLMNFSPAVRHAVFS